MNTMRKLLCVSIIITLLCSCDSTDSDNDSVNKSERNSGARLVSAGCYEMVIGEDTAGLNLVVRGDSVSGNLFYHWKMRDHNDGTFRGRIQDSVIYAMYTFQSEGIQSVREVAFKSRGDSILQAYGEIVSVRDTMQFRFRENLVYDTKHPFVKKACP